MKPSAFIVVGVVAVALVTIVAFKPARGQTATGANTPAITPVSAAPITPTTAVPPPRLLDLGANKCIPCKLMTPILEDLKSTYAGSLRVEFIDVWENKEAAQAHGISTIPTQIFFAPDGKELFRHEGFFSKADILAQWQLLGYTLKPAVPGP